MRLPLPKSAVVSIISSKCGNRCELTSLDALRTDLLGDLLQCLAHFAFILCSFPVWVRDYTTYDNICTFGVRLARTTCTDLSPQSDASALLPRRSGSSQQRVHSRVREPSLQAPSQHTLSPRRVVERLTLLSGHRDDLVLKIPLEDVPSPLVDNKGRLPGKLCIKVRL